MIILDFFINQFKDISVDDKSSILTNSLNSSSDKMNTKDKKEANNNLKNHNNTKDKSVSFNKYNKKQ